MSVFTTELVTQLSHVDISGFIINEAVTEIMKKCMIESEYNSIL